MREHITIPKVKDVHVASVYEQIPNTNDFGWFVYIINQKNIGIDTVLIVSYGYSKTKQTSTLRKKINYLPKKSFAKVEMIQEDLFSFTNQYKVSFFEENTLLDKTYTFEEGSIHKKFLLPIPLLTKEGILAI